MRRKETNSLDFSISVSHSNMLSFLSSFSLRHLNVGVPRTQSLVLFSSLVVSSHLNVKDYKMLIARPHLTLSSRFLCYVLLL